MNRLIDLIPFIVGALVLLFLGALSIDLFVRYRRRPAVAACACSHGFLSVNEARSLKPAPADDGAILVPIRLRPWPSRLVNSYRTFRGIRGLSRLDCLRCAWSMALIGTPVDRARANLVDAWSGLRCFVACFGAMAPLFALAIAGSLLLAAAWRTWSRLIDWIESSALLFILAGVNLSRASFALDRGDRMAGALFLGLAALAWILAHKRRKVGR